MLCYNINIICINKLGYLETIEKDENMKIKTSWGKAVPSSVVLDQIDETKLIKLIRFFKLILKDQSN